MKSKPYTKQDGGACCHCGKRYMVCFACECHKFIVTHYDTPCPRCESTDDVAYGVCPHCPPQSMYRGQTKWMS